MQTGDTKPGELTIGLNIKAAVTDYVQNNKCSLVTELSFISVQYPMLKSTPCLCPILALLIPFLVPLLSDKWLLLSLEIVCNTKLVQHIV